MKLKTWVRERWLELRWGSGVYLSQAITFLNLVLLLSIRFSISGPVFIPFAVLMFIALSSVAVAMGHIHRRWQQSTDVLVGNKAMIDEIVRRVKEEK